MEKDISRKQTTTILLNHLISFEKTHTLRESNIHITFYKSYRQIRQIEFQCVDFKMK